MKLHNTSLRDDLKNMQREIIFNVSSFQEQKKDKNTYRQTKTKIFTTIRLIIGGFAGGTVVKNPPANAGDTGLSPGPGRSHMLQSG